MRYQSFVQTMSGFFSRRNTSAKLNKSVRTVASVGVALTAVLCSATVANAQGVRLDPTILTYAGTGSLTVTTGGNGGLATAAGLNNPEGIAYDSQGNTYIADYGNNQIRVVSPAGIISAFAGTGTACTTVIAGADTACGDGGPASAATFNNPTQMQFDTLGNLYIADFGDNRIRKITATNGVITPASIITTVAGTGTASVTGNTGLATAATIEGPHGLALDSKNNLFIGEQSGCVLQYVPATSGNLTFGGANTAVTAGHIYTVAGQANNCGYTADTNGTTQGTASRLYAPTGISLDAKGNVYIGDYNNGRIRKYTTATGVITTIAGTGYQACPVTAPTTGAAPAATPVCGDGGAATAAALYGPTGVYVDGAGNIIIGDAFGARVREISGATGVISTLSGTSQQCTNISQTTTFSDGTGNVLNFPNCGDGTAATKALVSFPILISVNPQGNILYVDQYDNKIREIVEHIVFPATNVGSSSASQNVNLITTGTANTIITSITVPNDANGTPEFTLGTVTGCVVGGSTGNAPGVDCTIPVTFNPAYAGPISQPLVVVTNGGTFQFGLTGTGVAPVAVLLPGTLSTVAGTGTAGTTGNGGQATAATLNTPRDLTFDAAGNYYIGDLVSNEVRKVTAAGVISDFAGGGTTNYVTTPGGPATSAALSFPTQAAFDAAGNAYIPDFNNHVVARVDAVTGAITVFAGTGVAGYSGDGGLATAAQLSGPAAVAVDQATGNVYIADPGTGATSNQTIRLVNAANGTISTVAGNGTTCASSTAACGDGGLATAAQLNQPNGLALDVNGNLYISDTEDNRIRVVNKSSGVISTFAGTGTAGYTGDGGAAASAELTNPFQIQLDAAGDLYIADSGNNVIRFVSASTGKISSIVGNGTACTTVPSPACGDGGPDNVSALSGPDGVALDPNGNLYVAEAGTNRVRKVTNNPVNLPFPPAPAIGITEGPLTAMLMNIGNATLTYTTPVSPNSNAKVTTTSNPASPTASNAFSQTAATTCGPIYSTSGTTTLASGATCNYVVDFTPDTAVGNYVGTLVETDNSLYSGTGNPIYPTPLTQTVNLTGSAVQGAVTVLLASNNNPSYLGQPVTLTATVTGGGVAPTGTVTFTYTPTGSTTPVTITGTPVYTSANGVETAALTTTALPLGTDSVVATFNGDTNYVAGAQSSALAQVVKQVAGNPADTITAATASITYGTTDQLTYSIPVVTGAAVPAGTVAFTGGTGNTALGSATWPATPVTGTCPGGTGTCYLLTDNPAPTNIPVGAPTTVTGTFTATAASGYGSGNPTTTVTVAQAPLSADTLSASPNPATSGQTVTVSFFIPVPTGDVAPTGPVTFSSPGATFSTPTAFTATTVNGVTGYIATATTTNLPSGADTITGTYTSSDPNYAGGALTTPETINQAGNTGDAVTASPSPTTVGSTTTLTFTIPVVNGAAVPTGTVAFTSGSTALGNATWPASPTITNGNYVLTTTTTALPLTVSPATSTPITASYTPTATSGYGAAAPTTTDVVNQVPGTSDAVTPANTSTTVGTADALTYSIPVVAGVPVPAGTISFTSGTTNLGSATWPASPATGACPSGTGTCYLLADNPVPTNIPLTISPATSTPITATFTATAASGYASASPTTAVTVSAAGGSGDTLTIANNPTTYGTPDTLTFNIPATSGVPAPTGMVLFTSPGGVTLGSATWSANPTVTNGDYSLSISPTNIPVGSPTTVTATFTAGSTSGYGSAAPSNTVTVNKVPISNDGISATPSATTSGTPVVLSFTVPNVNGTAPANTATVTFTAVINGTTTTLGTANLVGTTSNGVTTYSTTTTVLPVGNDTVTGNFTGDGNYAGGALTTPVAISSNSTTDTVTVATNPTVVETPDTITFSIPVTTGAAVPTGSVAFTSGTTNLGSAAWPASPTVTNGNYTLSISTTALPLTVSPAASTPVLATYTAGGTSGYSSTSASTTVVVNQIGSSTDAVTVTNNPTVVGTPDPITFSIPVVAGAPVPSGSVSFTSGTTNLGTATWPTTPLTGACPVGTGTCYLLVDTPTPTNIPLTVAPATSTPVTATFTATSNSGYASDMSATTTVVVNPASGANDTLTVATNPTTYGTADVLTFSIPVQSGVPAPVGTVMFTASGVTLGTATWPATPTQSGGNYILSISPTTIPVGSPTTVTSTFTAGTGSGYASAAPTATVTVNKVPITNDGISATPSATTSGMPVTLSFTVPNVNGTAPANTATVTFTAVINGTTTTLGTANLVGTTANGVTTYTTTTTALPVGSDVVTGTFTGDGNYAGGALTTNVAISSNTTTDTVTVATNPTTVGSADMITFSIPVSTGAAVPGGTVTFTSGGVTLGMATWPAAPTATGGSYSLSISTTALPLTVAPSTTTPVLATFAATGASGYGSTSASTTVVVNQVPGSGDKVTAANATITVGTADALTFSIPVVTGAPVPTGTISFTSGTTSLGSATWPAAPTVGACPGGTGSCYLLVDTPSPTNIPLTVAPATSTPVTATYSAGASSGYASDTATTTVDVTPVGGTGGTLNVATNPTTVGAPDTLTFSIPVNTGAPPPAGTVTFTAGSVNLGMATWPANAAPVTCPGGTGSCYSISVSPTNIPLGNPTLLTATFAPTGASGYGASAPTANVTVTQIPGTGDTLSSTPNPSTFGQTVTVTETVPTVNGITPTGIVTFLYNGTSIGTGTVTNGIATTTTSSLPPGSDPITATYSGDANYAPVNSGPETQVVNSTTTSSTLAAGPNPSTFGTPVTLTETIAPINGACPTGPVTFLNNGMSIGTGVINLTNGSCLATLTTSTLPVGSDSLTATVPGNSTFSPITSGPVALVVNKANGPDTLNTSPNPSTYGMNVTITDTIPTVGGMAPTGTVNFYDFGTLIGTGTVTNGVATFVTGTLPVGTDSITATYLGDGNYAQVTTTPVNQVVNAVSTTATLSAGPSPSTFGTLVTITETIPIVNATPATGTVTFLSNGTAIGTGTINAQGIASITTTTLPVGTDVLTATYPGNTNYTAVNSGPLNQVVNKANGGDTLTVSPDPAVFGSTVNLTDTIPTVGGVAATGTVTFYNNGTTGTLIGTATVTNGVATLPTTTLPVGTDPITAVYTGDGNYATTTTGPVNETVTTGNTLPVLGASPNPATFGTTVTVTEAIPGINGVKPTGSVTFSYTPPGSTTPIVIGTGTVTNGVATVTSSTLPVGVDQLTAVYTGDSNYSQANSGPVNETITPSALVDTLTSSPAAPVFGTPVTITFTVPLVNGVPPTGVVTFYNGATVIGTGTVSATGVATITTSTLPVGSTTITAKYPGDGNYSPQSPTTVVTVGPVTPTSTVGVTVPNGLPPGCGSSVTLTDTITQVNGAAVAGTVQFYNNGVAIGSPVTVSAGGVATFTTTTLPCGATSVITAVFTPSAGSPYGSSTGGPVNVVVSQPDFTIAATPANQIVNPGDTATYTVALAGLTVPFTSPVALTATCNCQGVTISFANPTVTPGQGPTDTTMTVVTSPTFAMARPTHGTNNIFYGLLLLPLLGLGKVRRKLKKLPKGISYCLAALLFLGGLGAVTGCGGGYYGPSPKTVTLTITGTSGTLTHSTTVTLTVR